VETKIEKWVVCYRVNKSATLRLFCFPYAGGGATFYNNWPCYLPSTVEICGIQLPGRESRLAEAPCGEINRLVADVTGVIARTDMPFAFFGHSVGALLAFACARELKMKRNICPIQLYISARRAPHIPPRNKMTWMLPRDKLIQKIRRLGGTTEEVLANAELMDIYMPMIRADLKINEAVFEYSDDSRLPCPIIAFGGTFDPEVPYNELSAWSDYTTMDFTLNVFSGGHFYLRDQQPRFFECFSKYLE